MTPPAGFCDTPGAGVGATVAPPGEGTGAELVGRLLLGELTGGCVDWAMAAAGKMAKPATMAMDLIIELFLRSSESLQTDNIPPRPQFHHALITLVGRDLFFNSTNPENAVSFSRTLRPPL